jgi:NAD(P)-dependent dehydrogenase (short-subunit alcohol dehydrogenase family)
VTPIDFEGQVAVVTGSGRGIGREYALGLAERGAAVIVNDVQTDLADAVVAEIQSGGGKASASYDSVTTAEGGEAMVGRAIQEFGAIDVLIHNAGFVRPDFFEDLSVERLDAVLDVHLRGGFFTGQPAFRSMRERGYGRIVMISSNATFGLGGMANYSAAKAGLVGLVRVLAIEGAHSGVLANAVMPTGRTTISADDPIPGLPDRFHVAREVLESRSQPPTNVPLVLFLSSRKCDHAGEVYSSVAGRYARVFTGLTQGWLADDADVVTVDDIAEHLDEIRREDGYLVPDSLVAEYENVADQITLAGSMRNRPAG